MASYTAGQKIRASYFNVPAVQTGDVSVTDGQTTSTSYTNTLTTTGTMGVVFVGPYSGQVAVDWSTTGRNSGAGGITFTSCEVRSGSSIGSGSVVMASDDNTAQSLQSDSAGHQTEHNGHRIITGLTFGTTYNACITYKVNTNTGTFNRRSITVTPVP